MNKTSWLILVVMLLACVFLKAQPASEVIIRSNVVFETELMDAVFGNYYNIIKVSTLNPILTSDPDLLKWQSKHAMNTMYYDWDELSDAEKQEFRAVEGKIPFRFLEFFRFPNDTILLVFEAGQWIWSTKQWGGEIASASHNLGMAAFVRVSEGWKLTGYDLNLGRYGSYCSTELSSQIIKIGGDSYAIMTKDYDSALFTIVDGQPVVLLKMTDYAGYGHGSPEMYDSLVSTIPTGKEFYDICVDSFGENWETEENLFFNRRWSWDNNTKQFQQIEFKGNITQIFENSEYWFLDYLDE